MAHCRYIQYQRHNLLFAVIFSIEREDSAPESLAGEVKELLDRLHNASTDQKKEIPINKEFEYVHVFNHDGTVAYGDRSVAAQRSKIMHDNWTLLNERPDLHEIISRPSNASQPWVGLRRKPNQSDQRACVEMLKGDATMIDVDRELTNAFGATM